MTGDVVRVEFRRRVTVGHVFTCTGCGWQIFAAVHIGRPDMCFMCQELGAEMTKLFDRACRFSETQESNDEG